MDSVPTALPAIRADARRRRTRGPRRAAFARRGVARPLRGASPTASCRRKVARGARRARRAGHARRTRSPRIRRVDAHEPPPRPARRASAARAATASTTCASSPSGSLFLAARAKASCRARARRVRARPRRRRAPATSTQAAALRRVGRQGPRRRPASRARVRGRVEIVRACSASERPSHLHPRGAAAIYAADYTHRHARPAPPRRRRGARGRRRLSGRRARPRRRRRRCPASRHRSTRRIPRFPTSPRDIALVVKNDVPAGEVESAAARGRRPARRPTCSSSTASSAARSRPGTRASPSTSSTAPPTARSPTPRSTRATPRSSPPPSRASAPRCAPERSPARGLTAGIVAAELACATLALMKLRGLLLGVVILAGCKHLEEPPPPPFQVAVTVTADKARPVADVVVTRNSPEIGKTDNGRARHVDVPRGRGRPDRRLGQVPRGLRLADRPITVALLRLSDGKARRVPRHLPAQRAQGGRRAPRRQRRQPPGEVPPGQARSPTPTSRAPPRSCSPAKPGDHLDFRSTRPTTRSSSSARRTRRSRSSSRTRTTSTRWISRSRLQIKKTYVVVVAPGRSTPADRADASRAASTSREGATAPQWRPFPKRAKPVASPVEWIVVRYCWRSSSHSSASSCWSSTRSATSAKMSGGDKVKLLIAIKPIERGKPITDDDAFDAGSPAGVRRRSRHQGSRQVEDPRPQRSAPRSRPSRR